MFILTYDKKALVDVRIVKLEKNLGVRGNNKYALVGMSDAGGAFPVTVGFYPTEEAAIAELENISEAIAAGKTIYTIQ